jgi:organic hydroperoxide reductase OsmC/OhrA
LGSTRPHPEEATMSEHRATIAWQRGEREFSYDGYSRDHTWRFDGGVEIPGSAAPGYLGNPEHVDPEEAFVAAVASCHMLTFLAIAARKRLVVDRYEDEAVGHMEKNAEGRLAITRVTLRPSVRFGGQGAPSEEQLAALHHRAHENCFIANSVRSEIEVIPREGA